MAEVSLKGLKKVYDGIVTAVHDLNLDIAHREFLVLVGPSGCGKSTTLRLVAGLEDPTEGEIYIDGVLCNDMKPKDRDIAMVFQNYALYPYMTVYENLAFSLKMRKLPKKEIDEKVRAVADTLELTPLLRRKPKHLSGGQRQRVAIGRAMVRDPKVFLMDEPFSNLDVRLRAQMRGEIMRLRSQINATFIYVTHDQADAMMMGDRIVVMNEGAVNQIGTPTEVFEKPVNLFVAKFIGMPTMNLFSGSRLLLQDGKYYALIRGARFELDGFQQRALKQAGQQPGEVVCGVRPQHVVVGEGPLQATVEINEMLGSEMNVHARMGEDEIAMVVPTEDLKVDVAAGTRVNFGVKPGRIQLFDAETGRNLIWFDLQSAYDNAPVCKKYDF